MEVRKEVFRTGNHVYIGQDGKPAVFPVDQARLKHYCDTGNQLADKKMYAPLPLEHDKEAHLMTPADKLRNNAGDVRKYEMDVDKKTGEHVLFGVLNVQDAEIGKKLGKTINWVSPWLTSFVDSEGKEWNDVIGHVALTSRPRITKQKPFDSVDAAMSLISKLPSPLPEKGAGIAVSRAGRLVERNGKFMPAYPVAFSLITGGIRFSEEAVLEKKKAPPIEEDDDEDNDGDVDADDAIGGGGANAFDLDSMDTDGSGDVDHVEAACHLLELLGLPMPEGVTEQNFIRAMYDAALEKLHTMKAKKPETPAEPEPAAKEKPPMNPIVQEAQPAAYMSLEEIKKKVKDPKERAQAEAMFSLQKTAESLKKNAYAAAKKHREQRIERLCKMNGKAKFRDMLVKDSQSATFSLGDDGVVVDSMENALALLEAQAVDMPDLLKEGVKFSEQDQPNDSTQMSGKRAQELADAALRRMGVNVEKVA